MKIIQASLIGIALMTVAMAASAEMKVGFVNTERIFRDAAPAMKAQKRLEKEFEKRDQDLQRMAKQIQDLQASLDKNAVTMGESERKGKEREIADLNRDFQRKKREFGEDFNQRKNEELANVLDRANKAIKVIAEADKYDIIFQEAVYASPRIDITDKVIKALADMPEKK
ncbi:MAG: OmpH family outer membrane protein [Rhodocyclaceae bacterium]|nr:OmpH family outer membrane protein [Rhodocyclaceae bacterium]